MMASAVIVGVLMSMPADAVAGTTNSEPGAATHLNVARWLSGMAAKLTPAVQLVVMFSLTSAAAAASAKSMGDGVTAVPVAAAVVLPMV